MVELTDSDLKGLNDSWRWTRISDDKPGRYPDYYLRFNGGDLPIWRQERLLGALDGRVYMLPIKSCWLLDGMIVCLETAVAERCGELMVWEQVREIFPMYAYAQVIDWRTHRSFRIQRRGGTYHADVQTLTRADTMALKEIYHGNWSWDRRSVILVAGGRRIAASMNGRPHGHGAIPNNGMDGHFCIHFLGSRIHKSGRVDPAHQLMIMEAAGLWKSDTGDMPRESLPAVKTITRTLDAEFCGCGDE